ncbi:MAG TPA: MaoC family dehydratase [Methylomirabilota bacterium]|nr:MaoC family dehydratase [Methylomirabilota bacterium]
MQSVAALIGTPGRPGDRLPALRLRARTQSRYSANRIHDDTVARTYGYAAGLIAGTTIYGFMTRPLLAAWGPDWLARGSARVRFMRPIYDGDEVCVETRVIARSGGAAAGEIVVEVLASTRDREPAATAIAGLAWGAPPVIPDPGGYPAGPLPAVRMEVTPDRLRRLDPLGSPVLELEAAEIERYARELDDPSVLYRGPLALAHPGLLLQQANRALSENVALGPWVHVSSDLAHCGVARTGQRLTTRGRVVAEYERKGHRFVELEALIVAGEADPVLHVRHTAIWQLGREGRGRSG